RHLWVSRFGLENHTLQSGWDTGIERHDRRPHRRNDAGAVPRKQLLTITGGGAFEEPLGPRPFGTSRKPHVALRHTRGRRGLGTGFVAVEPLHEFEPYGRGAAYTT